ncbi:phage tail protein [Limisalsivibrio acetivorans]|uniref:phage tail protein n=1 Tax=Limisalsivibrio acetivorans TaxID=1304888 RepID=UPI0003B3C57F|nr:phage tail protein [Limisalsivibrio acetivorans]
MQIKIVPNALDRTNRKEIEVDYCGQTCGELFDEYTEYNREDFIPVISGKTAEWEDKPNDYDEVIFINDIKGENGTMVSFALGVALIGGGAYLLAMGNPNGIHVVTAGISMLAGTAVGMMAGMFTPNVPTNNIQDEFAGSRTYSWDGIRNLVGEGNVVPAVFGRHRVGGAVIEAFIDGEKDSGVFEKEYLNVLIALSEGEVGSISEDEVYVGDNNIKYLETVEASQVYPIEQLLSDTQHTDPVQPQGEFGVHTFSEVTCNLFIEEGLEREVTWEEYDEGEYYTNSCWVPLKAYISAECRTIGDTDWINAGTKEVSGRSQFFSVSFDMPEGEYELRFKGYIKEVNDYYYSIPRSYPVLKNIEYRGRGTVYSLNTRTGESYQRSMGGFSEIKKHINVAGKKITYGNYQEYISTGMIDSAVVGIRFPALFKTSDSGGIEPFKIKFRLEYKPYEDQDIPENWTTVLNPDTSVEDRSEFEVTGETRSEITYAVRCKFSQTQQRYTIRITRLTEDYEDNLRVNADSYLGYVQEILDSEIAYNNTALLGVRILATDTLAGNMPTISATISGIKVGDVRYIDETGVFPSDSPAPEASSNPANILYELLTSKRWGFGKWIKPTQIDIESFREFASYADEMVFFEIEENGTLVTKAHKRFEINLVLDKEYRASEIVAKICSTCRATPVWEGDKLRIVIDKADTPVQLFNMSSIVEDTFSESFTDVGSIPNQISAQILDEEDNYKQATIAVYDSERIGEPLNSKDIQLYGITSKSRAKREVAFALRKAKATKKIVSFEASWKAVVCQVGDLILLQHDTPQYGQGGEITSATADSLGLDEDIELVEGETYTLRVQKRSGVMYVRTFIHSSPTATTNAIGISGNSGEQGEPSDIQAGDEWVFGKVNIESKPYRILSIEKAKDETIKITAEEYNESIYTDDFDSLVEETKYSQLGLVKEDDIDIESGANPATVIPPFVTNIEAREVISIKATRPISNIEVYFTPAVNNLATTVRVERYQILYSSDGNRWQIAEETNGNYGVIRNVEIGKTYYIAIRSITNYGVSNNPTYGSDLWVAIATDGVTDTDLSSMSFVANIHDDGTLLEWTHPVSIEGVEAYEIWRYSLNDNSQPVHIATKPYPEKMLVDPQKLLAGSYAYQLYVVDMAGVKSSTMLEVSIDVLPPGEITMLGYKRQGANMLLVWNGLTARTTYPISHYIVDGEIIRESFLAVDGDWDGTKNYTISAVDTAGNVGPETILAAEIPVPNNPTGITHTPKLYGIDVSVDVITDNNFSSLEIWASETNNRADSLMVHSGESLRYSFTNLKLVDHRYVWARTKDVFGNYSGWYPFSDSGGVYTETLQDPSELIDALDGAVTADMLEDTLSSRIDLIDTNSVYEEGVYESVIYGSISQVAFENNSGMAAIQESMLIQENDTGNLQAEYFLKMGVNGYISGFGMFNDGSNSAFGINADSFFIVDPSNAGTLERPFEILMDGGSATVKLKGDLIADGSIVSDKIAAGAVTAESGIIDDLAVDTLQIANNAVTVPVHASSDGTFYGSDVMNPITIVEAVVVNSSSQPMNALITVHGQIIYTSASGARNAGFNITRVDENNTEIKITEIIDTFYADFMSYVAYDTITPNSTYTYKLIWRSDEPTVAIVDPSLVIMGVKK